MRKIVLLATSLLLCVSSAFAAKPVLAVAEFRNDTSAGWWSGSTGNDLAGMLSNELAGTEKFKMVERHNLGSVLDEQDLAASGRVSKSTGAKLGKLTGAQYVVIATVTSFENNVSGGGGGLSFHGIGVGGKHEEAYIAVDLRVVDTTTGEVEFTRTVEARSTSNGLGVSVYRGGFGGSLGGYEKTPTGKAIRGVIVEISDYLGCAMVDKDNCLQEYAAKEKTRRDKTKKSIKIE
jgi:curli biogenesis system outer membrane secretion channel CsgG